MRADPLLCGLLRDGIPVSVEVRGCSMSPFIRPGDVVRLRPPLGRLLVGAVLLLEAEGRLLLHRHVGWTEGRIITRGDNATVADGLFAPDRVLGVVTGVERRGRRVWAGLGPEGRLIAWLSRGGLLRWAGCLRQRVRRWLSAGKHPSYINE